MILEHIFEVEEIKYYLTFDYHSVINITLSKNVKREKIFSCVFYSINHFQCVLKSNDWFTQVLNPNVISELLNYAERLEKLLVFS